MAPEQAAADPDVDHRADIYALGITAYEMLTGAAPFAGLSPRALLTARMSQDPPRVNAVRADVPRALSDLVMRCLAREPSDRPQGAEELLSALDDPAVVSGAHHVPARRRATDRVPRDWLVAGAALAVIIALGSAMVAQRRPATSLALAPAAVAAPSPATVVVLPLVSIGADSANAYLADGITNELATALARVPGVRVVSPSRAAALLKGGKSPNEVGRALNVAQQLEGTVQRDGNRLRVTARLVGVSDGIMHWSDMYERDATDLLTVQEELARVITGAVGTAIGNEVADTTPPAPPTPSNAARGRAYDLYLRGRFQLGRRGSGPLKKAIGYFEEAIEKDPNLAAAHSGLADALGLLPLYTDAPAEPALASALRSADRAIALDSTFAEAYASRGVLHGRTWRWSEAERDLRRAIALDPTYAPAHQWLGELFVVTGRLPEATRSLERAAQLDPASPVAVGSLALALGLSGRTAESLASAERAVSYDSSLFATRLMLGGTRLYARQPAAAIAPLEAAVQLDPSSRTALGLLGFAYGASGDAIAAQRMRARIESMPAVPGTDVALARIALSLGDVTGALDRLERAARARDPFFSTESATSPVFDGLRTSPRYAALLRSVGLPPFRMVAAR
jgi:serine/threonine-protein kinase